MDPSISRAMQRDTEKRVHIDRHTYVHIYRHSPTFVHKFFPEYVHENRNVRTSSNMLQRGFRSHCLKVHKNPYLWTANKTTVATIKVQNALIQPSVIVNVPVITRAKFSVILTAI
jgi:hypothetical protein